MRVGLDLQGCLQYSTEGVVLCSGDQDWMASTVVGPVLFLPTYRRLRAGGERIGTLRTVGDAFRHAISLSDSQEECVTRRSVLTATWPLTGIMSFRRSSLFGLIGRSGLLRSLRFPAGPSEAGTCWFPGGM